MQCVFARWLDARELREQLAVGLMWVVLTVVFELALGTLLGLTRERMLADYDFSAGGFMLFGLLFMLLSPVSRPEYGADCSMACPSAGVRYIRRRRGTRMHKCFMW